MSSINKKIVNPEYESLFSFKNENERIEHEAHLIMFRFLSEIEKLNIDNKIKRKDLAKKLGTSASYITQLYNGDKLINLTTIAKLQDVFKITFDIKAKLVDQNYNEQVDKIDINQLVTFKNCYFSELANSESETNYEKAPISLEMAGENNFGMAA